MKKRVVKRRPRRLHVMRGPDPQEELDKFASRLEKMIVSQNAPVARIADALEYFVRESKRQDELRKKDRERQRRDKKRWKKREAARAKKYRDAISDVLRKTAQRKKIRPTRRR